MFAVPHRADLLATRPPGLTVARVARRGVGGG